MIKKRVRFESADLQLIGQRLIKQIQEMTERLEKQNEELKPRYEELAAKINAYKESLKRQETGN